MEGNFDLMSFLHKKEKILRVAHRGFHPENKIIGFRQAVENGCDMIECDLRLSADNHPVVIHDKTINRTTNGVGCVSKLKVRELQFYGIPSLDDLMIWLQQHPDLLCAFEIKDIGSKNILLLNKTLQLIQQYNMSNRSVIISFNQMVVSTSKMLCPHLCTGLIVCNTIFRNPIEIAKKIKADMLWVHYMLLPKVITLNECNLPLFVWTINSRKSIIGVDKNVAGIVSDDIKSLFQQ